MLLLTPCTLSKFYIPTLHSKHEVIQQIATIRVTDETLARLAKQGVYGDRMESIIVRLLDEAEGKAKPKKPKLE